ncbi:MAG: hypothetical protein V4463_23365 [Pseudomonadota bacterium]
MSVSYQHLHLAEVTPGMVLSDELVDKQGQVLLPKGAVLTANTIALLPRHGIDMVPILIAAAPDAPAPVLDLDQISARLAYLFRKNEPDNHDDWATGILRHYIEDYRLEREIEE